MEEDTSSEGSEADILPDELWLSIFAFLSDSDLLVCSLVCMRWHLLTQDARHVLT